MMKGVRLRGEKKEIRDGNSSLIPPSGYYIQYVDMWSANKGNKLLDSRLPCMPISLPCMPICLPISLPVVAAPERVVGADNAGPT
jgi:hypothetical protein